MAFSVGEQRGGSAQHLTVSQLVKVSIFLNCTRSPPFPPPRPLRVCLKYKRPQRRLSLNTHLRRWAWRCRLCPLHLCFSSFLPPAVPWLHHPLLITGQDGVNPAAKPSSVTVRCDVSHRSCRSALHCIHTLVIGHLTWAH